MNPNAPTSPRCSAAASSPLRSSTDPSAKRQVLGLLQRIEGDALWLHTPSGSQRLGDAQAAAHSLRVHDEALFAQVLRHGDIGLGETYRDGLWDSPDLPGLLALLMRQRQVLERAVYGQAVALLWYRLRHALNRNTRAGSRRNIHAHYDLGNRFYAAWLDETMNYSSAWWGPAPEASLADAQRFKMDRALDAAGVQAGSRVLEIGCGWGAVAERAARRGAQLTGITLSPAQLAWGQQRLADAGLSGQADLRLQDYRELPADGPRYDAIVSIEMVEAVGRAYWPAYFRALAQALRPGGRACVQAIVIDDRLFARYLRSSDFIQQYIFPGGTLPSRGAFVQQARRAGLRVVDELAFGADYARTLALWRQRFMAQRDAVRAQGFDAPFLRLWEFYLAYCEAAFLTRQTDVVQFTLEQA